MEDNSAIFVIVISLFIIIFIIISYFILSDSMFKKVNMPTITNPSLNYPNYNNNNNNNNNNYEYIPENPYSDDQVFHLRDNIYNYDEAKAACKAYNSRLATLDEVKDSFTNGANWCSYGWSDKQLALYPTQPEYWKKLQENSSTARQCGTPGVNGGYFSNKSLEFGVNCYGNKPGKPKDEPKMNMLTDTELLAENYKLLIDSGQIKVSPFSETTWNEGGEPEPSNSYPRELANPISDYVAKKSNEIYEAQSGLSSAHNEINNITNTLSDLKESTLY